MPKGQRAFTEHVAEQLRRDLRGTQVTVKGPLTLTVGPLQANLDRIFTFCSANATGCPREISTYVKGVAQTYRDRLAPPSKAQVRIIVRTRAYVEGAVSNKIELQARDLAGELVMLPASDMPRTIKPLVVRDNEELGLSAEEVFKLGVANLRKHLKPLMQIASVVQPGQIGHLTGDVYHSSRLVIHDSWAPLVRAQGGKLIVAVPATDTLLYIADDNPPAIDALRTLARAVSQRVPNPLSIDLFRWTPGGWEVVR